MIAIRGYLLEDPEITNYERFGDQIPRNDTAKFFPEDSEITVFSFLTTITSDEKEKCISSIAVSLNTRPLGIHEALNIAEDMGVDGIEPSTTAL